MQSLAQFHALRLPDSFPESLDELPALIDRYMDIQPQSLSILGGLYRPSVEDMLFDRKSVLILALLSMDFLQHSRESVLVVRHGRGFRRLPCPHLPTLWGRWRVRCLRMTTAAPRPLPTRGVYEEGSRGYCLDGDNGEVV